jgi:regulatory protein
MEDETFQKLKDYAFRLISIRPRSVVELKNKLKTYSLKKNISPDFVEIILKDLIDRKYLDDMSFAAWWKEQRELHNPKSQLVIKLELKNKGITPDIIQSLFMVNKQENRETEYKKACQIAEKKMRLYKNFDPQTIKKKLTNALFQRGFDWDTISRVIDCVAKI